MDKRKGLQFSGKLCILHSLEDGHLKMIQNQQKLGITQEKSLSPRSYK